MQTPQLDIIIWIKISSALHVTKQIIKQACTSLK